MVCEIYCSFENGKKVFKAYRSPISKSFATCVDMNIVYVGY